jgi:hypothetical protein
LCSSNEIDVYENAFIVVKVKNESFKIKITATTPGSRFLSTSCKAQLYFRDIKD